ETPEAQPRRLTASPAESEHPVAEINYYFLLYKSNKLYEKNLKKELKNRLSYITHEGKHEESRLFEY
ncbi:MAG: hypothetical protein ACQET6_19155, partial [Bacillota bacterium]